MRGIALRCGAAACFSLMSALLKLASRDGVGAPEMLFYRALFGLPVVLAWVLMGPGLGALRTQRPLAHLGRSVLGISSIMCTFQALILLPLADATTIGFTAPIFATILSALFLAERIGRHRWLAVAAGFAGVAIVMRPGGSGHEVPLIGVGIGLLAALGTAGVTITLRQIGTTENVAAIVFWFFFCSVVVGAALLPFFGRAHAPLTWLLLALGGVAGGLMQLLMTASLRAAPVSVLSPFDYLQIVGTILLGWLFWHQGPSINTLAGAALIASSGFYTVWREHRLRRDRPVPATQPVT
ncbi:EamA family transporter [Sphingomonas oleivorans]|uniref:EamA family transporter n=2 Tax=Sphingomonas oleivorans TaxID=1735121 RepID=A0A2T5FX64_9SPHN|nr:EamA family transporter [Sphingomonas oleivorans]